MIARGRGRRRVGGERGGAALGEGVRPPGRARGGAPAGVPKEDLLRDVWGFRSLGRTRTLDSHASRLRRKLNRPGGTAYVLNVWGFGYRLVATVG
jgi:hypothetical protein